MNYDKLKTEVTDLVTSNMQAWRIKLETENPMFYLTVYADYDLTEIDWETSDKPITSNHQHTAYVVMTPLAESYMVIADILNQLYDGSIADEG